ncbi:MAG: hypothetical protein LCH52_10130 [Bacteroidetes bacterium]|nr:hypothetical protein [Bacteroidota bacterium]
MSRDRHLNLFHNYNNEHLQIRTKTQENGDANVRGIIEDNVTRAFIIFLDFLSETEQLQGFFNCLPKEKITLNALKALKKLKKPQFDLQNLEDKADHRRVKEADVQKVLMIISTLPFDLGNLSEIYDPTTGVSDMSQPKPDLETGENRADAWILQKKNEGEKVDVAVLVEAKIGNNPISVHQILRHLVREKFGLNLNKEKLKDFCNSNIINLTWREINESLDRFSQTDIATKYFTKNLRGYFLMSNADVDIKNLLKEDTDSIERKQIFAHLLNKVNQKVTKHFEGQPKESTVIMSERPLAGLWDYWGIPDSNGTPMRSPHISMGLPGEYMVIGFDTFDMSQKSITKLIASLSKGKIAEYIKSKGVSKDQKDILHRYRLSLSDDRLWDWKKGQIKGEMYNRFKLEFDFDFLLRQGDPVQFLEERFIPYLKMGIKRFSLFYTLRIPYGKQNKFGNSEEEEIVRQDQLLVKLFKDEEKLVDLLYTQVIEFYEFIEEVK